MKKIEGDAEKCDCIHVHEDIVEKVEEKMPQDEQLADLAEFFRIFGDATKDPYLICADVFGNVCLRYCHTSGNDAIRNLPSAQSAEADGSCEEQKRRQNRILFSGRWAY